MFDDCWTLQAMQEQSKKLLREHACCFHVKFKQEKVNLLLLLGAPVPSLGCAMLACNAQQLWAEIYQTIITNHEEVWCTPTSHLNLFHMKQGAPPQARKRRSTLPDNARIILEFPKPSTAVTHFGDILHPRICQVPRPFLPLPNTSRTWHFVLGLRTIR